jgi:hypothetical protein
MGALRQTAFRYLPEAAESLRRSRDQSINRTPPPTRDGRIGIYSRQSGAVRTTGDFASPAELQSRSSIAEWIDTL